LAITYIGQGQWDKAEKLLVQVTEISKTKLGDDHPNTLSSLANLAFAWKSSGRDEDALNLLRDFLAKQKRIQGTNHPETLANSETLLEWATKRLNIDA
jgi:hypothetical protein